MAGKRIFFASDFHLGLKAGGNPAERERRVIMWLNEIAPKAGEIFLLGDVFDFWWEYKYVVPKGFTRFLGTIASLTDSGIPVHFFSGNHDMWIGNYLANECGIIIHKEPYKTNFNGKNFYLAHGEGLGTTNTMYKILLWIFRNKTLQHLYSALPPAIGVRFGHWWSNNSRLVKGVSLEFMGEEKEDLFRHTRQVLENEKIDYFVYGHRHLPLMTTLDSGAVVVILGDWIKKGTYAEWDSNTLELKEFEGI